jgi:hypothetical protein
LVTIPWLLVISRQRQKRLFQTGARDFYAGELLIARQQLAQNRLGLGHMDLERLPVLAGIEHSRHAAHLG